MRRLLLLLAALTGCPDRARTDPDLEAAVEILPVAPADANAKESESAAKSAITVRDYKRALARLRLEREDADALPKELPPIVLDQLIEQRVMALEASRLGIAASTVAVAREVAAMKRTLPPNRFERFLAETYQSQKDLERTIAERLVSTELLVKSASVSVSEVELQRAWEQLPEEKRVRPARVHASQIVLATEDAAQAVLKKLRAAKPADFAALARAQSIAPEAPRGGDLGWFERGDMPAVFDQICFVLEPGQVSDVTPSEIGYHVFKVIAREAERPLTFEEAKADRLLDGVRTEKQRQREREVVQSLMSRHRVVRYEKQITAALGGGIE